MRETLIGFALAAVLLGGLFFATTHRAHLASGAGESRIIDRAMIQASASAITSGFVGRRQVGAWEVACSASPLMVDTGKRDTPAPAAPANSPPLPLSLGSGTPAKTPVAEKPVRTAAQATPAPAVEKVSLGRCRASQAFRRKGAQKGAALAVNMRLVGPAPGKLGLFVRLVRGKKGETLVLRLRKGEIKLPITDCAKTGCVAIGILAPGAERGLAAAEGAELLLPAASHAKRAAVRLQFVGFPEALAAIRRAQF